jgi:HEAT repeat protein
MDSDNKIAEIESATHQLTEIFTRLLELSMDSDAEIRFRAIESFDLIGFSEVFNKIREGLTDPDELVRTTALEILGQVKDEKSLKAIEHSLEDESSLVRGSAALALGQIGRNEVSDLLKCRLLVEDDDEVIVPIQAALYALGQECYLDNLFEGLDNDYYRVRCSTANILASIANSRNKDRILNALNSALEKEQTVAASSSLKSAIASIVND